MNGSPPCPIDSVEFIYDIDDVGVPLVCHLEYEDELFKRNKLLSFKHGYTFLLLEASLVSTSWPNDGIMALDFVGGLAN